MKHDPYKFLTQKTYTVEEVAAIWGIPVSALVPVTVTYKGKEMTSCQMWRNKNDGEYYTPFMAPCK